MPLSSEDAPCIVRLQASCSKPLWLLGGRFTAGRSIFAGSDPSPVAGTSVRVLCELRVENLLLIERAELLLDAGLNVLTGETGAGKTVLAHALDLLMGGRPRSGIVRPGASEAYVEGVFALEEALQEELRGLLPETGPEDELQELVLARRVQADGRTRAYVNGRAASVGDLRELGSRAVSFYGQHEHRKLVLASAQLEILDRVCGEGHAGVRRACGETFREVRRLEGEIERLSVAAADREHELDLLEHEIAEIDQAAPDEEEHRRLLERRERLRRRDALLAGAGGASEALAGEASEGAGAAQALAAAAARLEGLAGVDGELDGLGERCSALAIEAQDLAGELGRYCERLQDAEGSLEAVEERLAVLDRLMRKHGGTIAAVIEHGHQARRRREQLLDGEVERERLGERLAEQRQLLDAHVARLSAARRKAATVLASRVREQLADLAMTDASFEVAVSPCEPGPSGGDAVELTIAPNPGVAPAPLREIASGGELSRVMLALSAACSAGGEEGGSLARSTLVFDEVDAGIGGHTARAVGERLRALARERQLICITHLPQIASLADRHFSVVKERSGEQTIAAVTRLDEGQVLAELVRMLGADERDAGAREHARHLLKAA
jgi:DNA repair protein RecN (Recombination protein N)